MGAHFPLTAFGNPPAHNDLLSALKAVLPILKNTSPTLKTQGCSFQKKKWVAMALTKTSFKENITFNKDCDLQGSFTVKMDHFFPLSLAIRRLKAHDHLSANIKFSILFEENILLKIEMSDALLRGKKPIQFDMNYSIYIDPLNENPLKKHKGGFLLIKDLKKPSKPIPLLFQ